MAHLNWQHHPSDALGPLSSNIRFTWTWALWHVQRWSDNPDTTKWPMHMICWAKRWLTPLAGQKTMHRIPLHYAEKCTMHELSTFIIFHLVFPDCNWPQTLETSESEVVGRGDQGRRETRDEARPGLRGDCCTELSSFPAHLIFSYVLFLSPHSLLVSLNVPHLRLSSFIFPFCFSGYFILFMQFIPLFKASCSFFLVSWP